MSFGLSAAAIGGIAAGVGAIGGAVISGNAAKSAASTQANAADAAAQLQEQQYEQTRSDLEPYRNLGTSSITALNSAIKNPLLTTAFTAPTAAEAAATPGYQFTLDNGLKAQQNSASARGLGSSGAALKGASAYATGLADSTYGDTYNRALQTFSTNYGQASDAVNRLLGLVTVGQNSAAQTGALGTQSANSVAGTLTSGAASSAAGTVGSANAINSGISSALGSGQNALLLSALTKNNTATDAWGTM
jgi:hypothetical protein